MFTDGQGSYELPEVPPGQYEFEVSKDGYNRVRTRQSQGLQLGLAQVARVGDITLNVPPSMNGNEPLILIVGEAEACQSIRDVGQSQGIGGLEKREPRSADGFADTNAN